MKHAIAAWGPRAALLSAEKRRTARRAEWERLGIDPILAGKIHDQGYQAGYQAAKRAAKRDAKAMRVA